MFVAPDAELDDGAPRRRALERTSRRTSCARAAQGLQGRARPRAERARAARRRGARRAPTVRSSVYADGDPVGELPIDLPRAARAPCGAAAAHERRSAAEGRGRTGRRRALAPRRARRHVAARQAAACASSPHAIARLGGAPGARQRRDLGHQRQDDDRRDGRGDPRAQRARASSTTAPGRTWPAAWRPRCMAARPTATPASSRSTSSGSASVVDELRPRALLLANLFRDQLDRYGELDTIADRWAAVAAQHRGRARPQRRRPDRRRPRPRPCGRARTSACRTTAMALPAMQHAADATHCRRCGAPYRYDAVYLGHLGRYHCDSCGATPPRPGRSRPARSCSRACAARASRCARRPGDARDRAAPPRALQRLQRARRRRARARARCDARRTSSPACTPSPPPSGAPRRCASAAATLSILLVKNPAGANEVLRTLALEDGEHDVLAVLNDNIADGRDVSWVWDADFEVLAPRVRRATCSGTRAAEMALRLKYAGVPVDRIAVEPDLGAGAGPRACARGDGAPLRPAHLHRDARAARRCSSRRGAARRGRSRDVDPRPSIWHDIECGAYDLDLRAVARAGRRRGRARSSTSAPGTGRVALDLARRGARGRRARPRRASCSTALRERARRASRSAPSRRRARLRPRAPLPARRRADADRCSSSAARDGPRALPGPRARATWSPGGAARRRAGRRAGVLRRGARPAPAAGPARDRRRRLREPAGRGARPRRPRGDRPRPRDRRASTAPGRDADDVIELDRVEPEAELEDEAARARAARSSRGAIPPDRRVRRLDGGDAPCLSARCASARSTPTS